METVFLFCLTVSTAWVCGYGLTNLLWPRELEEHRILIMPCVGYPSLILLTHFISGTFRLSVSASSLVVFGLLSLLTVVVILRTDHLKRKAELLGKFGLAGLLALPMMIVVLWPLFAVGAKTYQATVNPDFFLGLLDNEWLKSHPTDVIRLKPDTAAYKIFDNISGSVSESARYRGAYFAILLEALYRIPQRTGLALTIGLFHFCMPLSLFVMVRVGLGQSKTVATLSAVLLGISSSITLGYLSYYIGQASGLGFLPLLITAWFLCLSRHTLRTFLLALTLTSALWIMYLGLIPYAGAPALGLALYLLFSRQMRIRTFLTVGLGSVIFILIVHIRMMRMFTGALEAWGSLARNATLLGQYYIDFVTERFFPMFYGLTIYTLETSRLYNLLGPFYYLFLLYFLSICITACLLSCFYWFVKNTKDKRNLAVGVSCVIAYACVACNYIFIHPYGYGAFKNATWLQFILVFFVALGLRWIYETLSDRSGFWRKALASGVLVFAGVPVVVGNLFSSWEYGMIGLGHDTERGYMVVVHNVSGNEDYLQLRRALKSIVKPDESVGLAFVNSAQQAWVMYYLRDFKLSYLGQWQIPGDDENLPDMITRRVTDPYGNVTVDSPTFYHGATDNYFLVNQPGVVNGEIVKNSYPEVLWENSTFRLVRAVDTPDFMFVGRGFYRSEYRSSKNFYMPQAMKWTAEGGELHLLRASQPGKPYRLALTGYSGPGLSSTQRTIEFFHNKKKIGEDKIINGFGRIVSDPFYPKGDTDFLVFRIKERVRPPARKYALWHRDLPIEYRRLNLAVSDIELIMPSGTPLPQQAPKFLGGEEIFTRSYEFNGIEPNLWVRDEMSVSLPRILGSTEVSISLSIPSRPEFRFPLSIIVSIDGVQHIRAVSQPGDVVLTFPLLEKAENNLTRILLRPSSSFVPQEYNPRERGLWLLRNFGIEKLNRFIEEAKAERSRPLIYSVRLKSIAFAASTEERE